MNTKETIEIPLSKKKLVLALVGAILLVSASSWMLISNHLSTSFLLRFAYIKNGVAIVGIVFFGACLIFIVKKLSSKKPGLIINDEGIIDNTSGLNVGLIPWGDIREISTTRVMNQEFITIEVRNPEEYIARQSNPLFRKTMQMNHRHYGSPIQISANNLKTTLAALKNMITTRMIGQQ